MDDLFWLEFIAKVRSLRMTVQRINLSMWVCKHRYNEATARVVTAL